MKSSKNVEQSLHRPFSKRHIGPDSSDIGQMLETIGLDSVDELVEEAIPKHLLSDRELDFDSVESEQQLLAQLKKIKSNNQNWRSFIGMGYRQVQMPPVIQRNILENPDWYTHYTPYQSEISQGRLEALLNFQTMVSDLTGLEIANASLLDEATACAEAMSLMYANRSDKKADTLIVSNRCHPQNIAVLQTRAAPLDINIEVAEPFEASLGENVFGVVFQYPTTDGQIRDYSRLCDRAHRNETLVTAAADLLALTLIESPGSFGADVAVGNTQRLGLPMGYGGPHAAYFSTKEKYKRDLPGRLVGISKDSSGRPALRLALQTREQHIRRERATSNICTAQVLPAVLSSAYAVYHGPEGLRQIATRVHLRTRQLAESLKSNGNNKIHYHDYFDTLRINVDKSRCDRIRRRAEDKNINLRYYADHSIGISIDEATRSNDIECLVEIITGSKISSIPDIDLKHIEIETRRCDYLTHENFHNYQTETEFIRYVRHLSKKDISLTDSMIPLGSCTMKLNGTAELLALSDPEFNQIHPFAPKSQTQGYQHIFSELKTQLRQITGLPEVTLQPNSGAQGEYTGLLAIRAFHRANCDKERIDCLIPESAHGTNAASAAMAGMNCIHIDCDENGNIDIDDLKQKANDHRESLAAFMVTYPSTHGVFEENIEQICDIIHENGGFVYLDGANMNAQLGLCYPADYGIDVCHLNLHKTFSIPHGGGGPGMGPVCATKQLGSYLPDHPVIELGRKNSPGPVSAAPWGSASILPISWAYIKLMGGDGLREGAKVAILNANYLAERLSNHFDILYRGQNGRVAHEFIIDGRKFRKSVDISVKDISKRLIDCGFHAPTMSWPVRETLMIEPTESESKIQLDKFCSALDKIRGEIEAVENSEIDLEESPLRLSPHTASELTDSEWNRPYSRQKAAFPTNQSDSTKFWPPVNRVDDAFGDRNLFCTCTGFDAFS